MLSSSLAFSSDFDASSTNLMEINSIWRIIKGNNGNIALRAIINCHVMTSVANVGCLIKNLIHVVGEIKYTLFLNNCNPKD